MQLRSWVVALAGAIAVTGCGGGAKPGSTAGRKGSGQDTFTVTVNNQGQGTVTSSPPGISCPGGTTCSARFAWNTPVSLNARAGAQQYFNGWFGECSGTADCALTGNADKYVVSYFSANPEAHANFTSPAQHGPAYADFLAHRQTALDCRACHGASLQGQGLAPACASCHDAGSLLRLKRPAGPVAGTVAGGLEGYVRDVSGAPVASATVYLVKSTDIEDPTAAGNFINKNGNDSLLDHATDEPLEDAIAAGGVTSAVTDGAGYYRFDAFPADEPYPYNGRFITVVPALLDDAHLPGGSACRAPYKYAAVAGKRLDLVVSMRPSAAAAFVGPSKCLSCHTGHANQLQTLHANGLKPIGAAAPSRFPNWFEARSLFTEAGTMLYLVWLPAPYAEAAVYTTDRSTDPNLVHTARLYRSGTAYFIELKKVYGGTETPWPGDGVSGAGVYKVELAYGGGLYKQRFITKIGTSRYIIPLQYNFESRNDERAAGEFTRFRWQHYNLGHWGAAAATGGTPVTPPAARSFDHQCAGCHFTGYTLDLATNAASAVADPNGDAAFSGTAPETLNVTCETCHGPGSEHVAGGKAMVSVSLLTPEREVTICAQCHTRFNGKDLGTVAGNDYTAAKSEAGLALTNGTHAATMVAGTSRSAFVANHVSVAGDALWKMDGTAGNYVLAPQFSHQKEPYKHHQQASDFVKTKKYRNPYELLTCTACHDIHGDSAQPHQLKSALDNAGFGGVEGLCLGCHKAYLNAGQPDITPTSPVAERMKSHWSAKGIRAAWMDGIRCTDCHMPKTAKSGSGTPSLSIGGTVYYQNDIASHLLQMPRAADVVRTGGVPANQPGVTATPSLIPIPYTDPCGSCHAYSPKPGW